MHPLTIHPMLLALLALPSWLITLVLPAVIPFVSSSAAVYLHALVSKGEGWYASQSTAVHAAIAVVVGLLFTGFGSALNGVPGGTAAATACASGATSGTLSADCLTAILALASSPVVQVILTAILTGSGVLAVKLHTMHTAQKEMAVKAGVTLSSAAK